MDMCARRHLRTVVTVHPAAAGAAVAVVVAAVWPHKTWQAASVGQGEARTSRLRVHQQVQSRLRVHQQVQSAWYKSVHGVPPARVGQAPLVTGVSRRQRLLAVTCEAQADSEAL